MLGRPYLQAMTKLSKKLFLTMSPFHPNFEMVGDMTVRLGIPYSKNLITVEISPKTEHSSSAAARTATQEKTSVTLSLEFQKPQVFQFQGKIYEACFQNSDSVKECAQNFLRFELLINEI